MNADQQPKKTDSLSTPSDRELNDLMKQISSECQDDSPTTSNSNETNDPGTDLTAKAIDLGTAIDPSLFDRIADVDLGDLTDLVSQADGSSENSSRADNTAEQIEEIADDMLNLMRRVNSIENGLQTLTANFQQAQETSSQMGRTIAREIDTLRRDMVGDRKHTAATGLFNELIPMIDRLTTMRSHLNEEQDARMQSQLDGVLETLAASLKRLECDEFKVAPGDAFDPARMQCEAYLQAGQPGLVLEMVRPGYQFGDSLLRPASVTVGAAAVHEHDTGDDFDE